MLTMKASDAGENRPPPQTPSDGAISAVCTIVRGVTAECANLRTRCRTRIRQTAAEKRRCGCEALGIDWNESKHELTTSAVRPPCSGSISPVWESFAEQVQIDKMNLGEQDAPHESSVAVGASRQNKRRYFSVRPRECGL